MNTIYRKSAHNGNTAESTTEADANGQSWKISTMKTSGGRITCSAVQGEEGGGEGYKTFQYSPFDCKRYNLGTVTGTATEKKIKEVHEAGLIEFARIQAEEAPSVPLYVVGVGQIVWTSGYSDDQKRVIYEVTRPGHFKTVTLDGETLKSDSHLVEWGSRQGIGTYYKQGETMEAEKVRELVEAATAATAARAKAAQVASEAAQVERAQLIARGAEIVPAIPAGVDAVIVAELRECTSDPMSDYHGHNTKKVVYLAWSTQRENFKEMRKAADKFEPVQHLGTGKGLFAARVIIGQDFETNGSFYGKGQGSPWHTGEKSEGFTSLADAQAYTASKGMPEAISFDGVTIPFVWKIEETDIEKRRGGGYFLSTGHEDSTGWLVRKQRWSLNLESFQIAAAQGDFFCNQGEPTRPSGGGGKVTTEPGEVRARLNSEREGVEIYFDSKPEFETLAALKGAGFRWAKFNKCWYKKDSEGARALVRKYAGSIEGEEQPQEAAPQAAPQAAQAEADPAKVTPQIAAPWSEHGAKIEQAAAGMDPSEAAAQMEAAAARLLKMAAEQRERMQAKRAEIAQEVKFTQIALGI